MLVEHARNIVAKIGEWVKRHRQDIWLVLCLALVSWSSYNVGRIRALSEAPPATGPVAQEFQVRTTLAPTVAPKATGKAHTDPRVVVSKASTSKKYHFSWCASGTKIKESNRLWFDTEQAAIAAGYTLAGNCTR